jgi:hypothetical protein
MVSPPDYRDWKKNHFKRIPRLRRVGRAAGISSADWIFSLELAALELAALELAALESAALAFVSINFSSDFGADWTESCSFPAPASTSEPDRAIFSVSSVSETTRAPVALGTTTSAA